eukprot:Colp12_sorted_trinity150504_noHs@34677
MLNLTKDDVLYDLGCGDGKVLLQAAEIYGSRVVGLDIDKDLIEEAQRESTRLDLSHLCTFKVSDFVETDHSWVLETNKIFCYLTTGMFHGVFIRNLKRFLAEDASRLLVAYHFDIPRWNPIRKHPQYNCYLYDHTSFPKEDSAHVMSA